MYHCASYAFETTGAPLMRGMNLEAYISDSLVKLIMYM